MGAFMLLLRGVGLAIGGALVWLLFVTVPALAVRLLPLPQ